MNQKWFRQLFRRRILVTFLLAFPKVTYTKMTEEEQKRADAGELV